MAPANAQGPSAPDLAPAAEADPSELRRRLEAGEWVVDLRDRTAFAAGHLRGSYSFGLDGGFATYLGWLIAWGTPVTLLGGTPDDVAEAQRELVRIGIDRPAAQATGGPERWAVSEDDVRSFRRATLADLAQVRHHRPVTVLDVRRDDEHRASAVIGSVHVPLHLLLDRMDEVPAGEVWVHCASGYRASIGASLLDATGRHVVAVDDEWDNAEAAGLPLAPGGDPAR
jgi:rhodanese-related sulfurtransferase